MADTLPTRCGWSHVRMSRFIQDVYPIDLPDGTHYEPTWRWHSQITALRSDGVSFFVVLVVDAEQWEGCADKLAYLQRLLSTALEQLETYRECSCVVGVECQLHSKPETEIPNAQP